MDSIQLKRSYLYIEIRGVIKKVTLNVSQQIQDHTAGQSNTTLANKAY